MTHASPILVWRRTVLLLALSCVACGPSTPTPQPGPGSPAAASDAKPGLAVSLARGIPLAKDIDSLPRIAEPAGPLIARINLSLAVADRSVREQIANCKTDARDSTGGADWSRQVSIKLGGPGFLSLLDRNSYFCGGAHPDEAVGYVTFDLSTGAPIDWKTYLPAELVGQPRVFDDFNGLPATQLSAPALIAWYRKAAMAQLDPEMRGDCTDAYAAEELHVAIYLDAKHDALAVETDSFPHAITACVETAYMDIAELRRRGVDHALIDALETAHANGHWAADPKPDD